MFVVCAYIEQVGSIINFSYFVIIAVAHSAFMSTASETARSSAPGNCQDAINKKTICKNIQQLALGS